MTKTQSETTSKNHPQRKEIQEEYSWTISFLLQDMKGDIKENTRRIDALGARIESLRSEMDTKFGSLRSEIDERFRGMYTALGIGFTVIAALIVVLHFVS